jgi:hypothetical protein
MRELYVGHDRQILMLDSVLGVADCEIEDLLGEAVLLPVLNAMLDQPLTLTAADRATPGLVNQIEAAAARSGIALPDGWKPEMARRLAAEWSMKNPADLPTAVLDRASRNGARPVPTCKEPFGRGDVGVLLLSRSFRSLPRDRSNGAS